MLLLLLYAPPIFLLFGGVGVVVCLMVAMDVLTVNRRLGTLVRDSKRLRQSIDAHAATLSPHVRDRLLSGQRHMSATTHHLHLHVADRRAVSRGGADRRARSRA